MTTTTDLTMTAGLTPKERALLDSTACEVARPESRRRIAAVPRTWGRPWRSSPSCEGNGPGLSSLLRPSPWWLTSSWFRWGTHRQPTDNVFLSDATKSPIRLKQRTKLFTARSVSADNSVLRRTDQAQSKIRGQHQISDGRSHWAISNYAPRKLTRASASDSSEEMTAAFEKRRRRRYRLP